MPRVKGKPWTELSRHTGVNRDTIANWAKVRPKLFSILLEHLEASKNPDCTLNYIRTKLNSKQEQENE